MPTPASCTTDDARFDAREIPCQIKHPLIMQRWFALPVGAHFILVNDHDPEPLYYQFNALFPQAFAWDYVERGPEVFQIKITKLAPVAAPASIASPCGGNEREPPSGGEVDARGLMPPEPMTRILSALAGVAPGRPLRARTDRRPVHLIAAIETRGFDLRSEEQSDGSWLTTISRA